ncbi:prolipoprotein diacylglyceryl transferase family protein [Lentzea sp. NPDC051208]|uniref:prolipoprotein diacylglyceryl transferase family protein n=1 Tax=Lentzea sp. NPDC051208 TaxID=3154642 RepID=UPI0034150933
MLLAAIPSPTQGVWHLGPVPIRAYAFCIIAGVLVAAWLTERRYVQRGGRPGVINQIATWGVPFGALGAWIGARRAGVAHLRWPTRQHLKP